MNTTNKGFGFPTELKSSVNIADEYETYKYLLSIGCRFFPVKAGDKTPVAGCAWQTDNKAEMPNQSYGTRNVGIVLPLGISVIDIDSEEALVRCKKIPGWSDNTFTIKTPRGWHYYWLCDEFPQFAGRNPVLGSGVDSRVGGKGYVVGPGSVVNDIRYTNELHKKVNAMPEAMFKICSKKPISIVTATTKPAVTEVKPLDVSHVSEGSRNNTAASFAGRLFNTTASEDSIYHLMLSWNKLYCKPALPAIEIKTICRSIGKCRTGTHEGVFVIKGTTEEITIDNCIKSLGRSVRHNSRASSLEISQSGNWEKIEDALEATILYDINRLCIYTPVVTTGGGMSSANPVKVSKLQLRQAMLALSYRNQVDPFVEWLETLPDWDGTSRIDCLLETVFELQSGQPLASFAIKSVLIGAIKRAYNPGSKHDEMVILIGPQGMAKSTFWELLLNDDEWYGDGLNFASDDKGRVEALLGKVIVESAELRGTSKAEIDSLKAFLSRGTDHIRLAYEHYAKDIKRRCIIVGTTNDESCLPNDPTGLRRFVTIRVFGDDKTPSIIRKIIPKIRAQLWAEALKRYHDGEKHWVTGELITLQASEAELHRHGDQVLEDKLETIFANDTVAKKSLLNLCNLCGFDNPTVRDQRQVTAALRNIGAKKVVRRVQGINCKLWVMDKEPSNSTIQ